MNATVLPANNASTYFDLHVEGIGYLNRVRTVKPRKGEAFLACTIEALRGHKEDVERTKFDVRVSGEAAKVAISLLENFANEKKPVLIGFKLGDIYPEKFTIEKGERSGQTAVVVKGRLLQVKWAKVEGKPFPLPQPEVVATGTNG